MLTFLRGRLWDTLGTAVLALVLAVVVWVNAIYQNDAPYQDTFPQAIPIEMLNAPDGMVITNNPDEVANVQIKAFSSSWDRLTVNNFRVTVDLEGLGEGLHTVPLEVTCSNPTVTIIGTQPETLYVQIEHVQEVEMPVDLQVEDEAALPLGYAMGTPMLNPSTVTVEGPASQVKKVTSVVADLSVAGRRESVDLNLPLRAVDDAGKQINGVTIEPSAVNTRLRIEQRQNYREVAVLARTSGQPARGYYVSSLEIEPATVTVVGPPSVIATMPGLVSIIGEVDVTGATRLIAQRAQLDLPEGASVYTEGDADPSEVLVTVDIDAVMGGTTVEVPLKTRKLREGYSVSLSVPSVDVILTGPSVVLDELALDLVEAYVDLTGLEAGTHQIKVVVELRSSQNPQLADLAVMSVSPAFVEADIDGPAPGAPGTLPTLPPPSASDPSPTPEPPATSESSSEGSLQTSPGTALGEEPEGQQEESDDAEVTPEP
ncbi:MAG: hypothetical protein GX649_16065 [Chloroflexi bacterium]|nr:hypothetical protein [Chloroflexota bacterium]